MKRIIDTIFWISLGAFLLLGAFIVLGQLLGVLLVNPEIVKGAADLLNWPAFSAATVCALAAFVRQYLPNDRGSDAASEPGAP